MASMDNDIVRRGYMNVIRNPSGGMLGRVQTVASRRNWVVLRKDSPGGGKSRLELYRNEDLSGVGPVRTILLDPDTVKGINTIDKKKAFLLTLSDDVCLFQCSSRADMDDWYKDLSRCRYNRSGSQGGGALPDKNIAGEIYDVVPDDETYVVTLRQSKKLRFHGRCLLEILRDFENNLFHIALFTDETTPKLVVKWQIDHIRQYGSNQMAFKFETGTKSSTGVDWFIVDTDVGAALQIHKAVDYWAKHIVDQVKNTRPNRHASNSGRSPTSPTNASPPVSTKGGGVGGKNRDLPPNPSSPSSLASPGNVGGGSFYQPLSQGTSQIQSVYEAPEKPAGGKPPAAKPPVKKSPISVNPSPLYQPLTAPSLEGSHSTYEALTNATRSLPPSRGGGGGGGGGGGAASPPGSANSSNGVYMGLTPQTQTPTQTSEYQPLRPAPHS